MQNLYTIIPVLAPLMLFVFASLCLLNLTKARVLTNRHIQIVGVIGIIISLISAYIVIDQGAVQSGLIGLKGLGLSIRLDALSVTMLTMISILAFVILRFSANYLDGDPRKDVFFCRLATTIASVELLILSGNLFQILALWVITSVCLHYLLIFYRSRPQAIAAARKKFIVARLGDISLLVAVGLIYLSFSTGDLNEIFSKIQEGVVLTPQFTLATVLLVLTAVLKSAQFPTHGWLIEVVETPTPVSALLHAGLLNAGPFLMVRLGYLMIESTTASVMLIAIGGFTAMFASVVYLTQPSVKVSLGYSSVAHMGFSLLLCGLGIYSAAILHVVAHSFYKAHAFLSSGSAVEQIRAQKIRLPKRLGSAWRVGVSVLFPLVVYTCFCYFWGFNFQADFSLIVIGAIIVLGLGQMMAATVDTNGRPKAMIISIGVTIGVILSFFTLEHGARAMLGSELPNVQMPVLAIQVSALILVSIYMTILLIQLIAFKWSKSDLAYRVGVHLRNGLYANVIFDRIIGSLKHEKFKWANLSVNEEIESSKEAEKSDQMRLPSQELLLSNQ